MLVTVSTVPLRAIGMLTVNPVMCSAAAPGGSPARRCLLTVVVFLCMFSLPAEPSGRRCSRNLLLLLAIAVTRSSCGRQGRRTEGCFFSGLILGCACEAWVPSTFARSPPRPRLPGTADVFWRASSTTHVAAEAGAGPTVQPATAEVFLQAQQRSRPNAAVDLHVADVVAVVGAAASCRTGRPWRAADLPSVPLVKHSAESE